MWDTTTDVPKRFYITEIFPFIIGMYKRLTLIKLHELGNCKINMYLMFFV